MVIYKWKVFYWIVPMMGHSSTFKLKTRVNALWVKKVLFLVFFFFLYLSICILFYLVYVSFILLFACSSFNTFLFSYVSHFLLFTIQYLNSPFNTFIFKYSMFILFLSLYSYGWQHVHLSDCSFITDQSLAKLYLIPNWFYILKKSYPDWTQFNSEKFWQNKKLNYRAWWLSGLICHVSNSSRDRWLGHRLESRSGHICNRCFGLRMRFNVIALNCFPIIQTSICSEWKEETKMMLFYLINVKTKILQYSTQKILHKSCYPAMVRSGSKRALARSPWHKRGSRPH